MPSIPCPWLQPPEPLQLEPDIVHVWRVNLIQPESIIRDLDGSLSADERARAGRFRFEKDRRQFVIARGCLREILGSYLRVEAQQFSFDYSSYGKPALVGSGRMAGISFNVSHSGELALIACTRDRAIGIDIERIRPDFAGEEIARRFFSPREVGELMALPEQLRVEGFFTCWTRKEAYIKARGEGLSLPLDQFDVSLVPGSPAVLLDTRPDRVEAARWSMFHLDPGPGYIAALAVEGTLDELHCLQWEYAAG